jgi:hypothetical protein
MRLDAAYAVPTASFSLEVHRGCMPGLPKASPCWLSHRYNGGLLMVPSHFRIEKIGVSSRHRIESQGKHRDTVQMYRCAKRLEGYFCREMNCNCFLRVSFSFIPGSLSTQYHGLLKLNGQSWIDRVPLC